MQILKNKIVNPIPFPLSVIVNSLLACAKSLKFNLNAEVGFFIICKKKSAYIRFIGRPTVNVA